MAFEKRIDDLIEAGWRVLESDFDEAAFHGWRKEAFKFLGAVLGPEHTYTQYFEKYVRQLERSEVLTGEGILMAARANVAGESPRASRLKPPSQNPAEDYLPSSRSTNHVLVLVSDRAREH